MAGTIIDQWFAAASVGEDYKTMHVWDGDGNAARVFELNFQGGYINQADVKAFMVNKTTQERTDLTVKFTGTGTVTLSQAVPTTHQVTIYRDTNKTAPIAAFADGAIITAINLDRNAKQAVFAVAEMVDRFDSVTATAQDAIATAYEALGLSKTAIDTANGAVETADAATRVAADAAADSAEAVQKSNAATDTANSAKATAEGIDAKVNDAVSKAGAAVLTANSAKATAEGIDAKATAALSNSEDAVDTANAAEATANGINAKAEKALADSSVAVNTAGEALSKIDAATANLNKLWGEISSVDSTNHVVTWKGKQVVGAGGIDVTGGAYVKQGNITLTGGMLDVTGPAIFRQSAADWITTSGVFLSSDGKSYSSNGIRISGRGTLRADCYTFESSGNYFAKAWHVYDAWNGYGNYFEMRNTGDFVARRGLFTGGDSSVFNHNIILDWGGRSVMYQENGDIVNRSGSHIFSGFGASNLSGALTNINNRVNGCVLDVWLGAQGSLHIGQTSSEQTPQNSYVVTGIRQLALNGTCWIEDIRFRQLWVRLADGGSRLVNQV